MIKSTTALLMLGVSMATATTASLRTGAFTALVIQKRHGVGFFAGQTHSNKMFAANGTIGVQSTITQSIIRAHDFFGDETTRAQRDRGECREVGLGSAE